MIFQKGTVLRLTSDFEIQIIRSCSLFQSDYVYVHAYNGFVNFEAYQTSNMPPVKPEGLSYTNYYNSKIYKDHQNMLKLKDQYLKKTRKKTLTFTLTKNTLLKLWSVRLIGKVDEVHFLVIDHNYNYLSEIWTKTLYLKDMKYEIYKSP